MSILDGVRRVVLTHAHPDDETLATGVLVRELADRDVEVHVLTATRGEAGEIVPGTLPVDTSEDALSRHREGEMACAADHLGVAGRAWLGTEPARTPGMVDRRYRDSGMRWVSPGVAGPADESDARSFCAAPTDEAAADLAAYLLAVRPDLVITYDPRGGYGHPDHVRMHEVTRQACAAVALAMVEVYPPGRADEAPAGTEWHDWSQHEERVAEALRCYATQLTVHGLTAPYEVEHVGGQREPVVTRLGLCRAAPAAGV